MDLELVFKDFCSQLRTRTEFTSEDTVRYYWFASMLEKGIDKTLNYYSLEEPYDSTKLKAKIKGTNRQELDLWYKNGRRPFNEFAMEIKYHRQSKSDYAKTSAAGSIFGDLLRLLEFKKLASKNGKRLFLYVTDDVMDEYLGLKKRSKKNLRYRILLRKFYELPKDTPCFIAPLNTISAPSSFTESAFASFNDDPIINLNIQLLHYYDDVNCHVRLYEVLDNSCGVNIEDILIEKQ